MGPPADEGALLDRANALAGRSLAWVAEREGDRAPPDLLRQKGWIGNLLERALGASKVPGASVDFPELGVELKTLPVTAAGKPRESTWVCVAPLDGSLPRAWSESWVRAKLARVLWVPIVGDGPPGERRVGAPVLWSPSPEEEAVLRRDYEELADLVLAGELWQLEGSRGEALQLRPKAANGQELAWTLDAEAEWVQAVPRGFYLRPTFTHAILAARFALR